MRPSPRARSSACALALAIVLAILASSAQASAQVDPLPSWNEGPAKAAIISFVKATTEAESPDFVPTSERVATFDQDGTLWVEQPVYAQLSYALDRVPSIVKEKPELAQQEPFKTVLSGNHEAIAKLSMDDLKTIVGASVGDMTVEQFDREVKQWLASAKQPRFKRAPTELTYLPMREVMNYLRVHGYKTYIVTGGGQDFVRVFAEQTYGVPPEQVVGSAGETKFSYGKNGKPLLTKDAKLLLSDNGASKPENIHLMIGRRPRAAFGNSSGDQQMLEYAKAGPGTRLSVLVLHDDAAREYAYGPAQGLPASKVGTFPQSLYDEARAKGWVVISMKNDWRRIFAFDPAQSRSAPSGVGANEQPKPSAP